MRKGLESHSNGTVAIDVSIDAVLRVQSMITQHGNR